MQLILCLCAVARAGPYVEPKLDTVSVDGVTDHTTYRLFVELKAGDNTANVYTLFGDADNHLTIPPAY